MQRFPSGFALVSPRPAVSHNRPWLQERLEKDYLAFPVATEDLGKDPLIVSFADGGSVGMKV